jgi:hypothetical protein
MVVLSEFTGEQGLGGGQRSKAPTESSETVQDACLAVHILIGELRAGVHGPAERIREPLCG